MQWEGNLGCCCCCPHFACWETLWTDRSHSAHTHTHSVSRLQSAVARVSAATVLSFSLSPFSQFSHARMSYIDSSSPATLYLLCSGAQTGQRAVIPAVCAVLYLYTRQVQRTDKARVTAAVVVVVVLVMVVAMLPLTEAPLSAAAATAAEKAMYKKRRRRRSGGSGRQ